MGNNNKNKVHLLLIRTDHHKIVCVSRYMSYMSTATQKMSFCLTISTRRGTSPSAVDGEWPTAS